MKKKQKTKYKKKCVPFFFIHVGKEKKRARKNEMRENMMKMKKKMKKKRLKTMKGRKSKKKKKFDWKMVHIVNYLLIS